MEESGFAGTGATGDYREFFSECGLDGLGLFWGEGKSGFVLCPFDGFIEEDGGELGGGFEDIVDFLSDDLLGLLEIGELVGLRVGEGDEFGFVEECFEVVADFIEGDFEELGGLLGEFLLEVASVAVGSEFGGGKEESRLEALRAIGGEAEVVGNLVGGFKADAVDIACELEGVFADYGDRFVAVFTDDFEALVVGYAVGFEEEEYFAE